MEDYRNDPDYDPIPVYDYCEDCECHLHLGDKYYDVPVGRTYMRLCPVCAKKWFDELESEVGA